MAKVINLDLGGDIIQEAADFICENFSAKQKNFSRVACVFGGRRPALFLRRAIGGKLKSGFVPPQVFSMDDFVDHLSGTKNNRFAGLDAAYFIYRYAKENLPFVMRGSDNFAAFLPWAEEIISFIEQLDLEYVHDAQLINVEKSAEIGYEVPHGINDLLRNIVDLRRNLHEHCEKLRSFSRGMRYRRAADIAAEQAYADFDAVIFCGFYYLHKSEQKIIKGVCAKDKAVLIFQGNPLEWGVLADNLKVLEIDVVSGAAKKFDPNFSIYEAFDMHSQAVAAKEILSADKKNENTVVVLPRTEMLLPFLSQAAPFLGDFNVSLGYPLKRSAFYGLFELLFKAQETRRENNYYARDYLNLLSHPLVKNLSLAGDAAVTRVLVHRLEALFSGAEKSSLGGRLFTDCETVENEAAVYGPVKEDLAAMGIEANLDDLRWLLKELHFLFFKNWQEVKAFGQFAERFGQLLDILVDKSAAWKFPFNVKVVRRLFEIKDEFANVTFADEEFSSLEIWEILRRALGGALVSFSGSPLRGVQVLGLFETRSLKFKNVVVMDLNESVLPRLKVHEPLIPREAMLSLGLNRLEKEEEIQRYHFMRLLAGADKVHLIYEASPAKEKSRFIEELLWRRQKESVSLDTVAAQRIVFPLTIGRKGCDVEKTPAMVEFMQNCSYSSSRVNSYLNCPLEFYYHYVLGLKERDDLLEDVDAAHIGTFIHEFLEDVFKPFVGKVPVIDKRFRTVFFKKLDEKFENELVQRMRSESFLLKKIIITRLEKFLDNEAKRPVKRIISLEAERWEKVTLRGNKFSFVYKTDRVDELVDGSILVLDYKTGGSHLAPKKLKELRLMEMDRESIAANIRSFQLPLYYAFTGRAYPGVAVNAELYNIRKLERIPFITPDESADADEIVKICFTALEYLFGEMLDVNVPFVKTSDSRRCEVCAFKVMCTGA